MRIDESITVEKHLRSHLTDGRWHDACRYCLRRRVHGGTGVLDADEPGTTGGPPAGAADV